MTDDLAIPAYAPLADASDSAPEEGGPLVPVAALASHLLDRVAAAVLVVDLSGVIRYANPYSEVLYGRSAESMVGRESTSFASNEVSVELRTEIATRLQRGLTWEGDFTVVRPDGTTLDVHAVDSPVFDDAGVMTGVISLAFDGTERHREHNEVRRMLAVVQILRDVGETLATGLDAERIVQTTTDAARRLTGASVGVFVQRKVGDAGEMDTWIVRAMSGKHRESNVGDSVPSYAPLLRPALMGGTPTRVEDVTLDTRYPGTLDVLMRPYVMPLRSCLVAPVRSRAGDVVGGMVLAHHEADLFTAEDERVLVDIAAQAGIVLDVARLFRAAEREIEARRRSEDVQRFFAETSALLSWSLDYPETFERLAELCVPFLADLCLIDVAEEGTIRRVAAVHADPAKAGAADQLKLHFAPEAFGPHPAASIVRGGSSEFAAELSDEFLRATTRDDDHYRIVKELEVTSYICVPLTARGRTIGALTLVSAGSGRRYSEAELALAEEVARRAALAIDNARLFSERDFVARALQSSLLPPALPAIAGVHVAARYRAAGEGNEVGGDFYDVFQGGRNAWWFVVGDVSGKGPRAAAIAGLARHTLHAVAMEKRSPKRLLTALHSTLEHGEGRGEYCTVCCAHLRLDPRGNGARLSVACGGHPPPIIRRADRSIEVANCPGPLLGFPLRETRFVQQTLNLTAGDMVVLYTDGITEAHQRNEPLFGQERLAQLVATAGADVDSVVDSIIDAVRAYGPADPRDDLAVVAVQIASESGGATPHD